jgi:hypothetical protein
MKTLYDYKPYAQPQKAKYLHPVNEYINDSVTGGFRWATKEVETLVIGETDTSYIVQLKEYRECDSNESDYGQVVLLPLGFHKSRLVEFSHLGVQLELFQ